MAVFLLTVNCEGPNLARRWISLLTTDREIAMTQSGLKVLFAVLFSAASLSAWAGDDHHERRPEMAYHGEHASKNSELHKHKSAHRSEHASKGSEHYRFDRIESSEHHNERSGHHSESHKHVKKQRESEHRQEAKHHAKEKAHPSAHKKPHHQEA